jgi:hypothetical protein
MMLIDKDRAPVAFFSLKWWIYGISICGHAADRYIGNIAVHPLLLKFDNRWQIIPRNPLKHVLDLKSLLPLGQIWSHPYQQFVVRIWLSCLIDEWLLPLDYSAYRPFGVLVRVEVAVLGDL